MATCCMSWIDVLWNYRRNKQGMQIAILGLDNAGKTCLLYRLKFGHYRATAQTCGFNCERMKVGLSPEPSSSISSSSSTNSNDCGGGGGAAGSSNFRPITVNNAPRRVNFCLFDVAGHEKLRPLWRTYTKNCDGIIFVIDSAESVERLEETRLELIKTVRLCPFAPLIVVCNKQDLPSARTPSDISKLFGLKKELRGRRWALTGGCAITGEGYDEPNMYKNDADFDTSSRLADQTPLLELMFRLIFQATVDAAAQQAASSLANNSKSDKQVSDTRRRHRRLSVSLNRVAASTCALSSAVSHAQEKKNIAKLFA